jgi:hypothetical protein
VFRFRAACAVLLLAASASRAGAAPPGFAFLEVPAGARAAGLGGAVVSLADGVEGSFWNLAGLGAVEGTQVMGSHTEFIQQLKHDQFAVAGQLFGGGLAASVRAMYSQAIDERDALGNLIGTFGSHDLEFQLGYGWRMGEGTSFGLGAQAVRERLANESATTWSGAAGAMWTPRRWQRVRFGVSAEHLGPAAHYEVDGQRGGPVALPAAVQAGASWSHELSRNFSFTGALDTRATLGRQAVVAVGGELGTHAGASLRLGLRQGDDLANFSAGAGYRRGLFRVDYAWVPSKLDLGDTHRFSFAGQF